VRGILSDTVRCRARITFAPPPSRGSGRGGGG
jgi:hypothetical protein